MPGLDINWFRAEKGYDPNIIKKSLERRFRDPKLVDRIIEEDQVWRKSKLLVTQFDTISIPLRKSGTISANRSETERKPTRKTPVRNLFNSRMITNSSRRLSRMRRENTSNSLTNLLVRSETSSTIQFPSATMKTRTRSFVPGDKSLISKSQTNVEVLTITRFFRLLEVTTLKEVRKSPGTEDTS